MGSCFITVHYNWGNELHKGGDFLQDLEFKHASIQLLKCESKCVWPKARDFRNGPASSVWEESRQGRGSAAGQCESVTSSAWHLLWSRSVHKFLPWSQGNTKESSPTGDLHGTGRTKCKGRKFEQVSFLGCHLMCSKNYIFLYMLKKELWVLNLPSSSDDQEDTGSLNWMALWKLTSLASCVASPGSKSFWGWCFIYLF